MPNHKLLTDSLFRGISNIWVIKNHHQDICHEYLIMSSSNFTVIFKLEDYTLIDITNIFNIDRRSSTISAYNLKSSSYFVHVTAKNILVLDLSKVDSVACELVKFEFLNMAKPWNIVSQHNFHLFCFSQEDKSIHVFQLRNRARDGNPLSLIGQIHFENLGIYGEEISSFVAKASEIAFELVLATVSGYVYRFVIDPTFHLQKSSAVFIGKTAESIESVKMDNADEIFIGTRSGELLQVNFGELYCLTIDQVGTSPLKLLKLFNDTLMAYSQSDSILLKENSKECIKRRIIECGWVTSVELVYGIGKTFVAGIKDDSLYMITVPIVSENMMSKRLLVHGPKFTSFLSLTTGKWLLGCTNIQEKKNFIKLFDSNGIEASSIDRVSDEIISILPIDSKQNTIIVVSVTRDRTQSKIEMIDVESCKIDPKNEYVFDGAISKIKISDR